MSDDQVARGLASLFTAPSSEEKAGPRLQGSGSDTDHDSADSGDTDDAFALEGLAAALGEYRTAETPIARAKAFRRAIRLAGKG